MDFVKNNYQITASFPPSEAFGLVSQLRRAAISIPSNVAEGAARKGNMEFMQFLNIAQGSLSEIDTQIELAFMLAYIDEENYLNIMERTKSISRMLYGLSRSLQ